MQCPPPRPLPNSNPAIGTTSIPASRILEMVKVLRSIGDDHPWLQRHGVVGIIPLLALHLILVAAGLDYPKFLDLERISHGREKVLLFRDMEIARFLARSQADGADVVDDLGVGGCYIAVQQRENRVQVHVGAVLGHHRRNHPLRAALLKERLGDHFDHARLGTLAHANRHRPIAQG